MSACQPILPKKATTVCSVWDKGYRYGFNGKEQDKGDEGMGGGGSTYDYGFRIYNPNLGKFLSVDPLCKSYPWFTPYQFAGNGPILNIDVDGLENSPTQPNTSGNKTEASDGTNQQIPALNQAILTASITANTPNGGIIVTSAFTDVKKTDPNNEYSVNGKELNLKSDAVISFKYDGTIYSAHFNILGNFTGYYSDDGNELSYTKNTLPDKTVGGPDKSNILLVLSPKPASATGVVAILQAATAIIIIFNSWEVIHNLKDEIDMTNPLIPTGGLYFKI